MSAPEDRLVTLLERFRFPAPWAAVQEAKKEYDQACVDRGAAAWLGRATFSNDGTGPTRLNLFEQDAEDKWRRFQSHWQLVEEQLLPAARARPVRRTGHAAAGARRPLHAEGAGGEGVADPRLGEARAEGNLVRAREGFDGGGIHGACRGRCRQHIDRQDMRHRRGRHAGHRPKTATDSPSGRDGPPLEWRTVAHAAWRVSRHGQENRLVERKSPALRARRIGRAVAVWLRSGCGPKIILGRFPRRKPAFPTFSVAVLVAVGV